MAILKEKERKGIIKSKNIFITNGTTKNTIDDIGSILKSLNCDYIAIPKKETCLSEFKSIGFFCKMENKPYFTIMRMGGHHILSSNYKNNKTSLFISDIREESEQIKQFISVNLTK